MAPFSATTLWRFGFAMDKKIRGAAAKAYATNQRISVRGPRTVFSDLKQLP